jgi:hypothetical protein
MKKIKEKLKRGFEEDLWIYWVAVFGMILIIAGGTLTGAWTTQELLGAIGIGIVAVIGIGIFIGVKYIYFRRTLPRPRHSA